MRSFVLVTTLLSASVAWTCPNFTGVYSCETTHEGKTEKSRIEIQQTTETFTVIEDGRKESYSLKGVNVLDNHPDFAGIPGLTGELVAACSKEQMIISGKARFSLDGINQLFGGTLSNFLDTEALKELTAGSASDLFLRKTGTGFASTLKEQGQVTETTTCGKQ